MSLLGHALAFLMLVHPVIGGCLQLDNSLLKHLLVMDQPCQFRLRLTHQLQLLPKVFILILQPKKFSVLLVNQFGLLLNYLAQFRVTLQQFLHHIDRLNNAASYLVFRLVCCIVDL